MKEYLLLVRTVGDHLEKLQPAEQESHLKRVGAYISRLMQQGKLKSAQPLEFEGSMITSREGKLKDGPYNETKEVIAGYFLIQAENLEEAIGLAKENPVFELDSTRIEVRPIKRIDGIN